MSEQADELRDISGFFARRGDKANADWLMRAADTLEAASAFFAWFNRHYPEPSAHAEHPWCTLDRHLATIKDRSIVAPGGHVG